MTEPQHRRAVEKSKRRRALVGLGLMGLGSVGAVVVLIVIAGWWALALIGTIVVMVLGWMLAAEDTGAGTSPGSPGTRESRDSEPGPLAYVDTDNPDPGQLIPGRDSGEFYPPPPSRDSSRDFEPEPSRDSRD